MIDSQSRAVLHEHLQDVLVELVSDEVERRPYGRIKLTSQMPTKVLVNYVASTFVLVLDWWVETNSSLSPNEVNDLFRSLVLPTLVTPEANR